MTRSSTCFIRAAVAPPARRATVALYALLLGAALCSSTPALAQSNGQKIALDLRTVLGASTTPAVNWAQDVNDLRYVKVLIVSNADDAELTALRAAVMAVGGSISYRYSAVLALAALVPDSQGAAWRRGWMCRASRPTG